MGAPLKDPPVFLTLAQVKFNPVLNLIEYLPVIQDNFRNVGYPDFESHKGFAIRLQASQEGSQELNTPEPVQMNRFQFGNAEKTHLFILDSTGLTLQSTKYGNFENFSECFLKGLSIVHEAVNLTYIERIGLRYLDRIMPIQGKDLNDYLIEAVKGPQSKLGGDPVYSYVESMNLIRSIRLISRVAIQSGPLSLPPDLQIGGMRIEEKFLRHNGENATLDNDGFIEERHQFVNNEAIHAKLDEIHEVINKAFKETVTEEALKIWSGSYE